MTPMAYRTEPPAATLAVSVPPVTAGDGEVVRYS